MHESSLFISKPDLQHQKEVVSGIILVSSQFLFSNRGFLMIMIISFFYFSQAFTLSISYLFIGLGFIILYYNFLFSYLFKEVLLLIEEIVFIIFITSPKIEREKWN